MSENKKTLEKYIDGFNKLDHTQILSCLTDDVEWIIPGFFHITGKSAFDQQIENDEFEGTPEITITRMVEENNVVIVEGRVEHKRKDGGMLKAVFCDVFVMENVKIKQLTSYLHQLQ